MRVVMTGGGGFIGSHLLARMIGAGMDVTLLGSTIGKSRYTASLVRAGSVRFLRCDDSFSEEDILRPALADAEALVLLGYVRPSALSPARRLGEELVLNLAPLVRLLRAAEGKTRHVIFASSLGVYGSHASAPVRETDAPRPETPYAIAKLASEESIEIVCAAGGWTPCVLRYATVYGPGETVPRAIPNFIQAALDGQRPVIAGDGLDEHDYIHVTDVVDATMLALRRACSTSDRGSGRRRSTSRGPSCGLPGQMSSLFSFAGSSREPRPYGSSARPTSQGIRSTSRHRDPWPMASPRRSDGSDPSRGSLLRRWSQRAHSDSPARLRYLFVNSWSPRGTLYALDHIQAQD